MLADGADKKEARQMARLATLRKGDWDQFDRLLNSTNLTAEEVLKLNKNPEVLGLMLATMRSHETFHLVHGRFTPLSEQFPKMRDWNEEFELGIGSDDFSRAEDTAGSIIWPTDELTAVTLVPYLKDREDIPGYLRTFAFLRDRAFAAQEHFWQWDGYDGTPTAERIRLLKGIKHQAVGLCLEVIDLGAQRGRKPVDVRDPKASPHAGVLACAALHPEWMRQMDGTNVPYVWIPGYEVTVPAHEPWRGVPYLRFGRGGRRVALDHGWCDGADSGWAVPVLRECRS